MGEYKKYMKTLFNKDMLSNITPYNSIKYEFTKVNVNNLKGTFGYQTKKNYTIKTSFSNYKLSSFINHFQIKAKEYGWEWSPKTQESPAAIVGFLDGVNKKGECATFSKSCLGLWQWERPFGMEQKRGYCLKYLGKHKKGFFINFPIAGTMKLKPNVYKPVEKLYEFFKHPYPDRLFTKMSKNDHDRLPLMYWLNHWIICHGGSYYDPLSNKVKPYKAIDDTGLLHVTDSNEEMSYLTVQTKIDRFVNTLKFCENTKYYFKEVYISTLNSHIYIGPYTNKSDVAFTIPPKK